MQQTYNLQADSYIAALKRLSRFLLRMISRPKQVSLAGITVRVPEFAVGPVLRSLYAERYERLERSLLPVLLRPDDRVLELGSAIGLIGITCCKIIPPDQLLLVEANRDLIPEILHNFELNGIARPTLLHAIATAQGDGNGEGSGSNEGEFHVSEQFWASSDRPPEGGTLRIDRVARVDTNELLASHRATVLICDIEGGEIDVLPFLDYRNIRLVIAELHVRVIGAAGIERIRAAMGAHGLQLRQVLDSEVYIFAR